MLHEISVARSHPDVHSDGAHARAHHSFSWAIDPEFLSSLGALDRLGVR